jgi:hypothetical protein
VYAQSCTPPHQSDSIPCLVAPQPYMYLLRSTSRCLDAPLYPTSMPYAYDCMPTLSNALHVSDSIPCLMPCLVALYCYTASLDTWVSVGKGYNHSPPPVSLHVILAASACVVPARRHELNEVDRLALRGMVHDALLVVEWRADVALARSLAHLLEDLVVVEGAIRLLAR